MNTPLKLTLFSLLILVISCKDQSRNNKSVENTDTKQTLKEDSFISKEALVKDYEIFQSIFESANSGLYKYHNKLAVDSVFASNKSLITENTSYREFYNILWNVIDYTGSCHNVLELPDSLDEIVSNQKIFFPLPLKCLNKTVYSNIEHHTIPAGSEIVAINGIPHSTFLDMISKYVSTDGSNQTGKYANIETDWLPFYVYLAMGRQDKFEITFRTVDSKDPKKTVIESATYSDFYDNYDKRHSKDYENRNEHDYSYKAIDSINTGLLTVQTFALGGPNSEGHKQYAAFLDSVFTSLQNKKIETLIVDVRGNGGGNDPNDLLLYSYLTKREFRENKTAFTLFQSIPFPEFYIYDDIPELYEELKEEHSINKEGRYYQNDTFNKFWKPKANVFKGNIIMLIDPFVASAGSLFASLVKSDESTIVIGEETLGGYHGHTGHIPVTYELPNSKFLLTFSIVDIEQDVKQLQDQENGSGVVPDYNVVQSHQDFLNNDDTQLDFAIEKIIEL